MKPLRSGGLEKREKKQKKTPKRRRASPSIRTTASMVQLIEAHVITDPEVDHPVEKEIPHLSNVAIGRGTDTTRVVGWIDLALGTKDIDREAKQTLIDCGEYTQERQMYEVIDEPV